MADAALTVNEKERLTELEEVVERGLKTFVEVGNALMEIRDSRLYRRDFGTFEEYCRERWAMGRNYVNKHIRAAEAVGNLGTNVPKLPVNEAQVRPLTKLEPDRQQEAWQKAVETAPNGQVTGAHVEKTVDEMQESGSKIEEEPEPNYKPVWELEGAVRDYLDWYGEMFDKTIEAADRIMILSGMRSHGYGHLLSSGVIPEPYRKRDVKQAVNNVLEQIKQEERKRRAKLADDWAPWNARSAWACADCGEEHEADEPIAAYYSELRSRLVCGLCMGRRDGMIGPKGPAPPEDPEPMAVHYSSDRSDWETPDWLFDVLNEEFGFFLDVCATAQNAKLSTYFSPEDDGLKREWNETVCWMNPPYGREIGEWVTKAYQEAEAGALVVCLLPARTDTRWWWDWVIHGEVRFLKGRLKFGNAENSAPFPSAIVVFWPGLPYEKSKVVWWEVDEGKGELSDA